MTTPSRFTLRFVALSTLALAACGSENTKESVDKDDDGLAAAPIVGIGGKCVDDSGDGTVNGNKVQLYTCNNTDAQNWSYSNGVFTGPGGKCLDVSGGGNTSANGTKVQLWQCDGGINQQWTVNGTEIVGLAGKCLEAAGGSSADGTQLQISDCTGAPNQQWHVESLGACSSASSSSSSSSSGSGGNGGGGGGGGNGGSGGSGGGVSACVAAPSTAFKVACANGGGDAGAVQSALSAHSAVELSGTCNFGGTTVRLTNNQYLGGAATIDYSGSGYAIASSGNGNTVSGLTFNGGGVYLDLNDRTNWVGQYGWNITCNHFQNIVSGSNGVFIGTILGKGAHSTISQNTFSNIWGYGGGYPAFPSSPSSPPDAVPGSGIYWQMGLDETTIDSNTFDKIGFNAIKGFWDGFNGNTDPFTGHHIVVSNNVMTKVHRIGIEAQGAGQGNCPGGCNYSHYDSDGTVFKNNFYHDPAIQYDNFGFSWMASSANSIIANNTAVTENATCFWPVGIALENSMNGGVLQGNVMGSVKQSCAGGYNTNHGWAAYICPGYTEAGFTDTYQNNVACGENAKAISYDPDYSATTVEVADFVANSCPAGDNLATSNIAVAFTTANGQSFPSGGSGTWRASVVSNLSIKEVDFYVDGSASAAVTQELQDVNTNFASDRKWLYHATINVSSLASGAHTVKAVATDVSGATQTVSQSFTR